MAQGTWVGCTTEVRLPPGKARRQENLSEALRGSTNNVAEAAKRQELRGAQQPWACS